jgi:aminopeptidase-like protein
MLDTLARLLPRNRTIVTRDIEGCIDVLRERYPLAIHRYDSGQEYQTWEIPLEWNVRQAVVSHRGQVIASYEESPLFLAPYSMPFGGSVSREELLAHTFTNPEQPDAFCYEFRVAYDYRRRLKEWRISLPHDRVMALPEGPFDVQIDVETRPGQMLVGELAHPGESGSWFTFLSHYCHVGQVNDGIAGVAVMLETIERIRQRHPKPRHGYKALVMPETIGSSVYAATHEAEMDATLGAAFTELPGADAPLQFVRSRRADTYIDRVLLHVLRRRGLLPCRTLDFRQGWGNDELVFDAPGVGVPAVSLDRYPYAAFHTHHDDMSAVKPERLEEMVEIFTEVADVLEQDYVPRPRHRVPIYLTRYGLYADWTHERQQYDTNMVVLDNLWTGLSTLDIALKHGLDVGMVQGYIGKLAELGLVEAVPVTPKYTRSIRFLPSFACE